MDDFNQIQYTPLRVWNRCVMAFNIREDVGQAGVEAYMSQFNQSEKHEMLDMYNDVKRRGREVVLKEIKAGVPAEHETYYYAD